MVILVDVTLTPCFLIESDDFHKAWFEAVYAVVNQGNSLYFGSKKEPKKARDSVQTIVMTGNAIVQIQNCEIHPFYRMRELSIQQYKKEYDRNWFNEEYDKLPLDDKKRFTYVYIERLIRHRVPGGFIDQISKLRDLLKEQIETGISSNRHQVITWEPDIDMGSDAPPCLQRIWIRYYSGGYVDVHFDWRSRDLFNAWQGNLIGLIAMLLFEVILPNNCKISRIIDKADSLHIYEGSLGEADKILGKERERVPDFVKKLEYKYV
jgi:thymidylate synthase